MKNIIRLLCLTVMLRVWWYYGGLDISHPGETGTGILIGTYGDTSTQLLVRRNNGSLYTIIRGTIIKTKWVEVSADKG